MDFKAFALLLCLATSAFAAVTDFDLTPLETISNSTTTTTTKPTPAPTPETTTGAPTTSTTTTTMKPTPAPTTETTTTTTTTTPAPETTTTPKPTPAPTPETTTVPSTTTTTAQPTPAPTPETTTVTTTTTAKPTPAPTPETTTVSTTTAPPTTAAPPVVGEWIVKDGNITCVVAKMDFHVNVTYPTTQNKTEFIVLTPKTIDANGTTVDGKCGNATQTITIPLTQGSLTFEFALNSSKSSLTSINLNVTGLPDSIGNVSSIYHESSPLFATPVKMSYKCSKEQSVSLTDAVNNSTASLVFSDAQLQAFRTDSAVNFSDAEDCEGADTPDLVPIAVGISLGVMIIVVLVAYLIGRRRSQSRGYVSM